jgi:hypothetical protein
MSDSDDKVDAALHAYAKSCSRQDKGLIIVWPDDWEPAARAVMRLAMTDAIAAADGFKGSVESARALLAQVDKLTLRPLVAGWNGEGRKDGPNEPHPNGLIVTLPTTAGVVYAIDAAAEALRRALS